MDHSIDVTRDGAVATITMSNPPRHTMTAPMVGELDRITQQLADDDAVRVVVLTGGGDGVFIAHYEVGELAASSERAQGAAAPAPAEERLHAMHVLLRRLETMPKPTIAAINGNAAGGGCELSLACDFRLLADGPFHYGLPETSVGIIPGAGGTQRFTRILGRAKALDLILHARLLSPADALAIGLVHRVLPLDTFADEVKVFADDLARRAPVALAAAKQAIVDGEDLPIDAALLLEQRQFDRTMRTADAAGAMRAVLRGERYEFEGR